MLCFKVDGENVKSGIGVTSQPYPHFVLGAGGHKRATWVALGKRDADRLVKDGRVLNAGALELKDKGRFLIVAPRSGDDRVMVLWSVSSGYRGSASIEVERKARILASDTAWHSGRGSLGEDAEALAIVEPGGSLLAHISGRRVECNCARLTWDGKEVKVVFFPSEADVVDEEGDYV